MLPTKNPELIAFHGKMIASCFTIFLQWNSWCLTFHPMRWSPLTVQPGHHAAVRPGAATTRDGSHVGGVRWGDEEWGDGGSRRMAEGRGGGKTDEHDTNSWFWSSDLNSGDDGKKCMLCWEVLKGMGIVLLPWRIIYSVFCFWGWRNWQWSFGGSLS